MSSTGDSAGSGSPVIIIAGPTASGKTGVGIRLAQALGGEIVSADARQVYRYMDIGTAKPTSEEQQQARHHLIDVVSPDEDYSAGRFANEAQDAIVDIVARAKHPIVVGGSGLYIRALVDGFSAMPEIPSEIRARIAAEAEVGQQGLYERLKSVDPVTAERLHPNDRQRILRGLEVYESSGERLSALQARPPANPMSWPVRFFGLEWPRDRLYDRIDSRVEEMVELGLVAEVSSLRDRGYGPDLIALRTFGYREVYQHLEDGVPLEAAVLQIKQGTRRYAKRQLTWFRQEDRMEWVRMPTGSPVDAILNMLDTERATT